MVMFFNKFFIQVLLFIYVKCFSVLKGAKIEVSINKNFISKFRSQLAEGNVYKITYFAVSGNNGSFRATEHDFKIFFNGRTRVVPDSSEGIPFNGLTLKNSYDVETSMGESDYLIGNQIFKLWFFVYLLCL